MLITTECHSRIDEWINVLVNGRNYTVKVWEEGCDDPFEIIIISQIDAGIQTGNSLISVAYFESNDNDNGKDDEVEVNKEVKSANVAHKLIESTKMADLDAQLDNYIDKESIPNTCSGFEKGSAHLAKLAGAALAAFEEVVQESSITQGI